MILRKTNYWSIKLRQQSLKTLVPQYSYMHISYLINGEKKWNEIKICFEGARQDLYNKKVVYKV